MRERLKEIRKIVKETEAAVAKLEDIDENSAINADMVRTQKAMGFEKISEIINRGDVK